MSFVCSFNVKQIYLTFAQSAGAEYTPTASLQRGKTTPPHLNECTGYGTKKIDEVPVMLELWGMRSTLSVPSLQGPFWPGIVAPDKALSMS